MVCVANGSWLTFQVPAALTEMAHVVGQTLLVRFAQRHYEVVGLGVAKHDGLVIQLHDGPKLYSLTTLAQLDLAVIHHGAQKPKLVNALEMVPQHVPQTVEVEPELVGAGATSGQNGLRFRRQSGTRPANPADCIPGQPRARTPVHAGVFTTTLPRRAMATVALALAVLGAAIR
jgi:hypothetical protein